MDVQTINLTRREVPIQRVLADYGYAVSPDESRFEQSYRCDLHGTVDRNPSARVYPSMNSTYCSTCTKSRDVVQFVQDKEGVDAPEAARRLRDRYLQGRP